MKKNLWFKLGLFCAALVLVATCFISTAWAKYTKTSTLADTAKVAKFEVKYANSETAFVENITLDLFDTTFNEIAQNGSGDNLVSGNKLIAPGSHGETSLAVSNTGQVDVKITIADNNTKNDNKIPVKFVFKAENKKPETDTEYEDLTAALASFSCNVKDGDSATIYIFWKWVSDDNDADTILGINGSATYELKLFLTAEQILPGSSSSTGN